MPRVRLLPITIFVAALMLTVRVGDLWEGFGAPGPRISVSQSLAAKDDKENTDDEMSAGEDPSAAGTMPTADDSGSTPRDYVDDLQDIDDIEALSRAQRNLLRQLGARRVVLDRRGADLDLRESLLDATELRVSAKIAKLQGMRQEIEALLKKYDKQEDAKLKSLVKIYETMKPKKAAAIFEDLEMPVLLAMMERMREARLASILAAMGPSRAREITRALAERRQLPNPKG